MTIYAIPTTSEYPRYTQRVTIDGATYTFTFRWNGRDDAWYFDVADAEGTPLMAGRKLVTDSDLLATAVHDRDAPQGLLVAWDMTGSGVDAGRDDFGTRVQLRYYTADEL